MGLWGAGTRACILSPVIARPGLAGGISASLDTGAWLDLFSDRPVPASSTAVERGS